MHIIIDYGLGNINSVVRGFQRAGIPLTVSDHPDLIAAADSLVLPGVGAFGDAMNALRTKDLEQVILNYVATGRPMIGICLGMQLLYELDFEHGKHQGLGIIPGEVVPLEIPYKVPHMGWNNLSFARKDDPILKYIREGEYVYFVHSFYAKSSNRELVAYTEYGVVIPAIVRKENVYGIQFHPEKSGDVGHRILTAYREVIEGYRR